MPRREKGSTTILTLRKNGQFYLDGKVCVVTRGTIMEVVCIDQHGKEECREPMGSVVCFEDGDYVLMRGIAGETAKILNGKQLRAAVSFPHFRVMSTCHLQS